MKRKKELLIESIQKMDTNMLDVLLDESKTYHAATKEIFLEKLYKVFATFKDNGDTTLLPYNGICKSDECENKGCDGVSFVGDCSNAHFDLIIEESEGDIVELYQCHDFETCDKSIEKDEYIILDIKKDERANFKPDIDFLILDQNCKNAFDELFQFNNVITETITYLTWLEKHHELFNSLDEHAPGFYSGLGKFCTLYFSICDLMENIYQGYDNEVAVQDYSEIEKSLNSNLLKWLVEHERFCKSFNVNVSIDIDFLSSQEEEFYNVYVFKIKPQSFEFTAKLKISHLLIL